MSYEVPPANDDPFAQRRLLLDMLHTCYADNIDKVAIEMREDGMRAALYGTVSLQLYGKTPSYFTVTIVDASERTKLQYYIEMMTTREVPVAPSHTFSIDNNAENLDSSTAYSDRQLHAMILPKTVFCDAPAAAPMSTIKEPDARYISQLLDEDVVMRDFYVDIARKRHNGESF